MNDLSRRQALQTLGALGVAGAAAATAAAQEPKEDPKPGPKRVAKILEATYQIETSQPPNLIVTVVGEVPTGGWTETQLLRRVYVTEPADGIWEYDLLSKPPEGFATQVISQVKASDRWEKIAPAQMAKIKGIRVFGLGDGIKTVMFTKKREG
jgi:hypothetical protein